MLTEITFGQKPTAVWYSPSGQDTAPGSFCLSSDTLVLAKRCFDLVQTPPDVWGQAMSGVFAVQFVEDTTTTLILTQHFLIALFLSRLTSSTVPLNMVEQSICFAMNQQIDCFYSLFLNLPTLLCLASLFHRREREDKK